MDAIAVVGVWRVGKINFLIKFRNFFFFFFLTFDDRQLSLISINGTVRCVVGR